MTIMPDKGDIIIPDLQKDILLKEDILYIQENKEVTSKKTEIGDILILGKIRITLFENNISIEGNPENYRCLLQPCEYKEIPFDGFPYYKRSPRILYQVNSEKIELKTPPRKESISKGTLAQVVIPPIIMMIITACVSALMHRGIYVIASICMTSVTVIFSIQRFFKEKRDMQRKNFKRAEIYEEYLVRMRKHIRQKQERERKAYSYQMPDANQLEKMVFRYDSRLYERGVNDEDFLEVSLGYYTDLSQIKVFAKEDELQMETDELQEDAKQVIEDFKKVTHVPLFINLHHGHLGIVGEEKNVHNQLKYLLMQICFFHSYHDVQIVFIGNEKNMEEFSYLRWYPHLRIQSINVVATIFTNSVRDQILGSILQVIKDRKQRLEENNKDTVFLPHFLFVIDDARLIQDHAIMEYLGKEAERLGISIIYTTNQMTKLPENIKTVCTINDSEQGHLTLNDGRKVDQLFEVVSMAEIKVEKISRKTAAIIHEKGMVSKIPDSITFFEMYKIQHPQELDAQARWNKHEAHKSLAVPLGVREQDNYVELNLHEKAHGPHGLVAGTTGSGKSEIVQSYILSLATNFHPYEVGFLLIDYKGGGMANLFQKLPHLLGTITNLDGAESHRAMVSIKSELARRQRVFNEYGVNHINGYHKLYKIGKVKEPIPHLFLISDEFAELKKEQPEFMKELVSTARIGRSLGIHLILATQKPSGVVDDQIWTNSKFKLCLKVQNEADSREMLKTPDAASIVQPGRAYLQVGNNEIYELFQSAYSGASYSTDETGEEKIDKRVYLVNDIGQGQLINQDLGGSLASNQIKKTQLDVVVEYLAETFDRTGLPEVRKPWLPPLQEIMVSPVLQNIKDSAEYKDITLNVTVGVRDIPEEQKQEEYKIDFLRNGHVILFASTGYGKTVFLETLLLSLCARNSVKNFHAYILDFGNNALLPLKSLPHIADYITYDDVEKQQKLIMLLTKEIKQRKSMMAEAMAQNFDIYNQSAAQKLPAIIIVLDNYDVVKELDIDENFFVQLARDGANLGIYLAITASRSSVVKYALMNQIKTKIAGFNYESAEARNIVGRSEYTLPEIKGRTLVKGESVNLMQIYSPVNYTTGLQYNQNLMALIKQISMCSSEEKVKGIAVLPEQFSVEQLYEYEAEERAEIYLGLEKQEVKKLGIYTVDTPFLVVGPVRSGKSNVAEVMLKQMGSFEKIYLFDSKTYELQSRSEAENVEYIDGQEKLQLSMEELKDIIEERKEDCRVSRGKESISQFYYSLEKYCIFINGLSDFAEFTQDDSQVMTIIAEAVEVGILVVMIGHAAHMPARNETAKVVKLAENGLILGEPGINTPFPTFRGKELPERVDEGLLYKRGNSIMIRIPKA